MRTTTLPRGLSVTQLGFGAAQLGNLYRSTTDEASAAAVDAAWDAGIRYFDTAPHYGLGLSERRLGDALARRPREQFVVSTKVGRLLEPSPGDAHRRDDQGFDVPATHRRVWDFSRDAILRSLESSLTRTGLDRIDIVYLHDPDEHWEQASTTGVGALVELRDQGVVGAVGAGMNQTAMLAEFIRRCDVDIVMAANRHTLLEPDAERTLLPLAEERGVGVVAAAVYNSGLLSRDRVPADARYDYGPASESLVARANEIAGVTERHGVTLPVAALQFPQRHPAVVSVVVGMRTAAHVRSNVERWEQPVPDDLWNELRTSGLVGSP